MEEPQLQALLDSAHEAVISIDDQGKVTYWNSEAERTFGWSSEEMVGRRLDETIIPSELREAHRRGLERYLATGEGEVVNTRIEVEALHRSGQRLPVELAISAVKVDGAYSFHGFLHDITDRKRLERYLSIERSVSGVLADSDALAEALPRVLRALGEGMGWELGAFWSLDVGDEVLRFAGLWHADGLAPGRWTAESSVLTFERGEGLPGRVWESDAVLWIDDVQSDGNFPRAEAAAGLGLGCAIGMPVRSGGKLCGAIEFFAREIAPPDERLMEMAETLGARLGHFIERCELSAQKDALARTDKLTGLANRRAWDDELSRALAVAKRHEEQPLCMAMIDLDHFKAFNDEHGHAAGDEVLRTVARAWDEHVREHEVLARYGGDEFALLLPGCTPEQAQRVIDRLEQATQAGQGFSAGLVCWDGSETAEELFLRADGALYEAKDAGSASRARRTEPDAAAPHTAEPDAGAPADR